MSLRGFHIFFICFVIVASFAIGAAVFGMGFDSRFGMAIVAFGVAAAVYGVWFVKKSRRLIL